MIFLLLTLAGKDFSTSFFTRRNKYGSRSRCNFCKPSLSCIEYNSSKSSHESNLQYKLSTKRKCHIIGYKAKERISKRVLQENKARQIFRKTNVSYLLIRTRACVYQGIRNVRFSENLSCFVFL